MTVITIRTKIAAALGELPNLDASKDELERHANALAMALEGSTNEEALKATTAASLALEAITRARKAQRQADQLATDYANFV